MSKEASKSFDWIAIASWAKERRGCLGWGKTRVELPPAEHHTEMFLCEHLPDGTSRIQRVVGKEDTPVNLTSDRTLVVRVNTATQPMRIIFPKVASDSKSCQWDLVISGSWGISDAGVFVRTFALDHLVSPEVPLSKEVVESWLLVRTKPLVLDHMRAAVIDNASFENLRQKDVLPPEWWENQLGRQVSNYGITIKVRESNWESADAANAEAEQKRLEMLTSLEHEKQRQREAELREMALAAGYEKEKLRIESNMQLSAQEKNHQLELVEKRYKKETIEAETDIESAKRAAERVALEHDIAMARLKNDLESVQEARAQAGESDRRHREIVEAMAKSHAALEKLVSLHMLGQLVNPKMAHQALERLVSPEFGFQPDELAGLGYGTLPQILIHKIRHRAKDGDILIQKKELRTRSLTCTRVEYGKTRDIGTVPVHGLPINSALRFEVATKRSGYVTILNLGTSGAVYLHVPNAYVGIEAAKAEAERTYEIPGTDLLPFSQLQQRNMDYIEIGPPGWEHLAVLISDEPFAELSTTYRATPLSPFVELSDDELERLYQSLSGANPMDWSAGILSFLVEE